MRRYGVAQSRADADPLPIRQDDDATEPLRIPGAHTRNHGAEAHGSTEMVTHILSRHLRASGTHIVMLRKNWPFALLSIDVEPDLRSFFLSHQLNSIVSVENTQSGQSQSRMS